MQKILRNKVLARRWRKSQNPHPQANPKVRHPAGHPHTNFVSGFVAREVGGNFCTSVHRFAQSCEQNFIDVANGKHYLARQIEPGSFRTLRINLEGAASLTAGCAANRTVKREALTNRFGECSKLNRGCTTRGNREG